MLICAVITALLGPQIESTVFVSPLGSDAWSGRNQTITGNTDGPKKTIAAARDALRAARTSGRIVLLPGRYEVSSTIRLGYEDRGLTIESSLPGQAVIAGSVELSNWQQVSGPEQNFFAPDVRGRVLRHDLSAWPSTLTPMAHRTWNRAIALEPKVAHLIQSGSRLTPARWPNQGYATVTGLTSRNALGTPSFRANLGGLKTPASWSNMWMIGGLTKLRWTMYHEPIKSFDPRSGEIDITLPMPHHQDGGRQAEASPGEMGRFFLTNSPYEIDAPGEYFVNNAAKCVYLLPKSGSTNLSISRLSEPLFSLSGASDVKLKGLTLEGGQSDGISLKECTGVTVSGCTIQSNGYWGVRISGGSKNTVESTKIRDMGEGGIAVNAGDVKTLTSAGTVIKNCSFSDLGKAMPFYRPGVMLDGVGTIVDHCTFVDLPHAAIIFDGNNNTIQYCKIERVCLDSNDASAIYGWSDWTSRGNLIARNVIKNVRNSMPGNWEVFGVYLDGSRSGVTVTQNLIQNCDSGINLGSGLDNVCTKNAIVDCPHGISIDMPDAKSDEVQAAMKKAPISNSQWAKSYPGLGRILAAGDQTKITQATIEDNSIINAKEPLRGPRIYENTFVIQKNNEVGTGSAASIAGSSALRTMLGFDPASAGSNLR